MDLLPLSYGDGAALQFELLVQPLNGIGGVRAHEEEADERRARGALLPGFLQVQDHALCVPSTHCVSYVLPGLGQSAVRTPTPAHEEAVQSSRYTLVHIVDRCLYDIGELTHYGQEYTHVYCMRME